METMVDKINKHPAHFAKALADSKKKLPAIMGWHPIFEADVHRLCKEFSEESLKEYGLEVTDDRLKEMIAVCKEISFFLLIDGKPVGLIAGFMTDNLTNKKTYLNEVIWYVNKDHRSHGKLLMKEFERAAVERGADAIVMVCMCNSMTDRLDKIYKRLGYKPVEVHYMKEINKDGSLQEQTAS